MTWELAYAHDAAGRPVRGSREALVAAVELGAEVRIFIDYGDVPGCYKEAQAIWIKGGHVYAQNTATVSCAFTAEYHWGPGSSIDPSYEPTGLRFLDDAYHYYEIVATTGDADEARWNIGEHTLRGRNQRTYAMTWFVRR